jgi:tRNA-specific 2-thiouridylase
MSGGVDSSVAAALLRGQGHEVIGVTMRLLPSDAEGEGPRFGGCCGVDAVVDAKRVAHRLGIPHYVMDFRDVFSSRVIADFAREYGRGRTPNPCVRCNQHVKFDALLTKASQLGAEKVATGHYARVVRRNGAYLLKKGMDRRKDQSYFLYVMTQEQLRRTLFPLGGLTKEEVRCLAARFGLPVADKPDSQEVCFAPEGYAAFLQERAGVAARPGLIVDARGKVLGEHQGIAAYTIGQRRGLGIASGEPLYVVVIDSEKNSLVVGSRQQTCASELTAAEVNWIPRAPRGDIIARARIRHQHQEAKAVISSAGGDKARVRFDEPQMAIAPGQAVVFYDDDAVLGGGIIEEVRGRN